MYPPLAQACSLSPIQNSQFKIHNSLPVLLVSLVSPVPALLILPAFSTLPPVSPVPPVPKFKIPFALFRAHYRLKKRLSLVYKEK